MAVMIGPQPERSAAYVFDQRVDTDDFTKHEASELAKRWADRDPDADYFPIKILGYNKCPTVAPVTTLDEESRQRLKLDMARIQVNLNRLLAAKDFYDKIVKADEILKPKSQPAMMVDEQKIDELLYDGFVDDSDRTKMSAVRAAKPEKLKDFQPAFKDERLKALLPVYKARQFPETLSEAEASWWQKYRQQKLVKSGWFERFQKRLVELSASPATAGQRNLLDELRDYAKKLKP
jgi:exodeoxyribonuclease I